MSAYFYELSIERCATKDCDAEIVADGEHGPICANGHEAERSVGYELDHLRDERHPTKVEA